MEIPQPAISLAEVLKRVRDDKLTLPMLEDYRDSLIHFKTDALRREANLKKERALYLLASEEPSAAAKRIAWDASESGQKLIELQGMLRALPSEISSLQGRIYAELRLQG